VCDTSIRRRLSALVHDFNKAIVLHNILSRTFEFKILIPLFILRVQTIYSATPLTPLGGGGKQQLCRVAPDFRDIRQAPERDGAPLVEGVGDMLEMSNNEII
jgi:hypothetical protein